MYKAVNKNNLIRRYIVALALHTGETTVHWEDNKSYISGVEYKRVSPRVTHIDIPVFFL